MFVEMFSWVNMTPLGAPLVPLVYIIVQMLDGSGGEISTGFSLPWHKGRADAKKQNYAQT